MKTTKWILLILSLAVLGAAIVQWQAASGLHSLNQGLLTDQTDAVEVPKLSQTEQEELARLQEENRDLLKLRNEVRQLRDQTKTLGGVRAENKRLREATAGDGAGSAKLPSPEGFISREALADVGTATPEAAVQTLFWSMREGNVKRFLEVASPNTLEQNLRNVSPEQLQQLHENLRKTLQRQVEDFSNFRIVGQDQPRPDTLILKLQSSASDKVARMAVRLYGNEWRVEDPF